MDDRNRGVSNTKDFTAQVREAIKAHKDGVEVPLREVSGSQSGTSDEVVDQQLLHDDVEEDAADFSGGVWQSLYSGRRLDASLFAPLKLLTLAGTRLSCQDVSDVLGASPRLERLDLARCSLTQVPVASQWARMECLSQLFLHQNHLRSWSDITNPFTPRSNLTSIIWFTGFNNPISAQPEYRRVALQQNPKLLLVDYWVVTDDERLDLLTGEDLGASAEAIRATERNRFFGFGKKTEFCTESYMETMYSPYDQRLRMLKNMREELWGLRVQSNFCSAACFLQARWKMLAGLKKLADRRQSHTKATTVIQRWVRARLWKQNMLTYTKNYLEEVDELDLLLTASEMVTNNAMKLIKKAVSHWIYRRKLKRAEREATLRICRVAQGFLSRRRTLKTEFELDKFRGIYVAQHFAWEFLLLVNIVNKRHGLPPLPRSHKFEAADAIGICLPDVEEYTQLHSTVLCLNRIASNCIVRNKRAGRRPDLPWDGPPLAIRGQDENPRIRRAYEKVRRRAVNVDNYCRKCFLESCVIAGEHPIDLLDSAPGGDHEEVEIQDSVILTSLVMGPKDAWPEAARRTGEILNLFMNEARAVGTRPRRGLSARSASRTGPVVIPGKRPMKQYRQTCWTSERLIQHASPTAEHAADLLTLMLQFGRVVSGPLGRITSVAAIPFLSEYHVRRVTAATVIQSTYRAFRERMELPVQLRTALVMRRAAICIQRGWRWGLLKRRMELLIGAAHAVSVVDSNSLFVEERLFLALNVINCLDRLPPLVRERDVAMGLKYKDDNRTELVLIDTNGPHQRRCSRTAVLPLWLQAKIGEVQTLSPDDGQLKQIAGVQGILQDGNTGNPEDPLVEVTVARLAYEAKLSASKEDASPALIASGGTFRYIELRYQSVTHARRRALALFLCTYNTKHNIAVPAPGSKAMLRDYHLGRDLLRLWDVYSLTWPVGNRVAPNLLRLKGAMSLVDLPVNGKQSWDFLPKPGHWKASSDESDAEDEMQKTWRSDGRIAKTKQTNDQPSAMDKASSTFARMCDSLANRKAKEEEELNAVLAGEHNDKASAAISRLVNDQSSKQMQGGDGQKSVPITGICGRIPPMTDERAGASDKNADESDYRFKVREMVLAGQEADLARARAQREEVRSAKQASKDIANEWNSLKVANARKWAENHNPPKKQRTSQSSTFTASEELDDKELAYRRQLIRSHRESEKALFAEAEGFVKIMNNAEDKVELIDKVAEARLAEERAKSEARVRYQAMKDRQQVVKEARNVSHQFKNQVASVQRFVEVLASDERIEQNQLRLEKRLDHHKRKGDHRASYLAEKYHLCLQQRRDEIDRVKLDLQDMKEEKAREDQQALYEQRCKNKEQKSSLEARQHARSPVDGVPRSLCEEDALGKMPSASRDDMKLGPLASSGDSSSSAMPHSQASSMQPRDAMLPPVAKQHASLPPRSEEVPSQWCIVQEPLPRKPAMPPGFAIPLGCCNKPKPPAPIAHGSLCVKPPRSQRDARRARSARGGGDRVDVAALTSDLSPKQQKAAEPWIARLNGGQLPPMPVSAR